jgi:hypothetical protein
LFYAVTYRGDDLQLTPEQRRALNEAALSLDQDVWLKLASA